MLRRWTKRASAGALFWQCGVIEPQRQLRNYKDQHASTLAIFALTESTADVTLSRFSPPHLVETLTSALLEAHLDRCTPSPSLKMTQTPFFTSTSSAAQLQGTTLVVPAVSIGSVSQLAIDLLLHDASLKLEKVGRLDPAFCFPFVGPSDSGSDDLTTALEGTLSCIFAPQIQPLG